MELIKLFFRVGDRVRWAQPKFNAGVRQLTGTIETECGGRDGFYYVREDNDLKRVYLVLWSDLNPL